MSLRCLGWMPISEWRVSSLFIVISFNLPFFVIVYAQAFFFVLPTLFAVSIGELVFDALAYSPNLFAIRAFVVRVH
jgi:hypothetical protein